jgi:hypothetical protein
MVRVWFYVLRKTEKNKRRKTHIQKLIIMTESRENFVSRIIGKTLAEITPCAFKVKISGVYDSLTQTRYTLSNLLVKDNPKYVYVCVELDKAGKFYGLDPEDNWVHMESQELCKFLRRTDTRIHSVDSMLRLE